MLKRRILVKEGKITRDRKDITEIKIQGRQIVQWTLKMQKAFSLYEISVFYT